MIFVVFKLMEIHCGLYPKRSFYLCFGYDLLGINEKPDFLFTNLWP